MTSTRRRFLRTTATTAVFGAGAASLRPSVLAQAGAGGRTAASPPSLVRPRRLRPGDTVGLVDPASATWEPVDVEIAEESLAALGLKTKRGEHLLERRGYFAGSDRDRAADLNAMMRDAGVHAIHCMRGGWGSARLLEMVDFDAFRRAPKPLIGFSDITVLLLALHARTGVVTFHGPNAGSDWNHFNVQWFTRVVMEGAPVIFENDKDKGELLTQVENRVQTITPGIARGRLLGGNLTMIASLMGSGYLPVWDDSVLFLEDVEEEPYRLDRALTQLSLCGVLQKARAVIWGTCTECIPGEGYGSLTLTDVLHDHLKPLGVPAWQGAMIGHVGKQFTLPIGVNVEVDATAGTIRTLEAAVA